MSRVDPSQPVKCKAKSSRTGQPCKQYAIKGSTVCRTHGGSAPQVIAAAKARLMALVDPAVVELGRMVKTRDKRFPAAVKLSAVKDVLDRNGLGAVKSVTDGVTGDFTFEDLLLTFRRVTISGREGEERDS